MPITDTRPVHALKPKKPRPLSPMETLCGVDPYKAGVRVHRPRKDRPLDITCRTCIAATNRGEAHQRRESAPPEECRAPRAKRPSLHVEMERLRADLENITAHAELDLEQIHEAAGGRDDETAHCAVVRLRNERDAALAAASR